MTRRKMILLIIGSLITVSTAVGVGLNFAIGGSSQYSSSLNGIDTSSPISEDAEKTTTIDKEKDNSPSSSPAKIEINDKRKVNQSPTKDNQEPHKQTNPSTKSPIVIRKEGGTPNTNNQGSQLIIGDVSKLNLLPKENKDRQLEKDDQSKPAVVIIKDAPTVSQNSEVKNEAQSKSNEQNSNNASVAIITPSQPQESTNIKSTPNESSPQNNEVNVQVPSQNEDSKQQENQVSTNQQSENSGEEQKDVNSESSANNQLTSDNKITSNPSTQTINLTQQPQNGVNEVQQQSPTPPLSESEVKVNTIIEKFKTITPSNIEQLAKDYTIAPNEEDEKLFFTKIPREWLKDNTKVGDLMTFWQFNYVENLKKSGLDENILSYSPELRQQNREKFLNYLNLAKTGQLGHNIVASGGSFKVDGVSDGESP